VKISEFPSTEEFCVRDCLIANTKCKLVFPNKLEIDWNDENKIFRSSIWTEDGYLVSASFKKFTNLEEKPDFEPLDLNQNMEFIHKMDGSTLVISKFKGELIVRTRGTVDASILDNGHEIEILKEKYPILFDNEMLRSEGYSILTEWYSPKNVIVEKEASEPTLWVTGIINHFDYSYLSKKEVDLFAKEWNVERPKSYNFNTIKEMVDSVQKWEKGEGVVIYGNSGQVLKKVKSLRYLYLHKIKSQLNSSQNLIEFYLDKGMPSGEGFYKIIETEFDFEIALQLKEEIEKVCNAGEKSKKYIDNILEMVHDIRKVPSRKEQAEMIKRNYGENSSYAFSVLDNKEILKIQWFKLIQKNYES